MQENSNKIVNKFLFKIYFLYELGGASEIKIKNFVFDFVFLSACTNFAP